ncbi:hypothetical protein ACFTXB_03885 [Streptomyces sp. NPDC057074]|uniref:linalool dehydratase/isomerase domain-containing protein n=1 Tax=Streptomyces sp. NPDC057074 TaxID=3346015 RepID=UPI00362A54C7
MDKKQKSGRRIRAAVRAAALGGLVAAPLMNRAATALRHRAPSPRAAELPRPGTHRDIVHPTTIAVPERDRQYGPISRKRQRRTYLVLGAVEATGLALAALGRSPSARAGGLGLMLPGAGDALNRQPVRAATAFGGAVTGLLLWIGSGNHLATPVAWLGSAALAARRAEGRSQADALRVLVPLAVGAGAAGMALRRRTEFAKQKAAAEDTNRLLESFEAPLRGADRGEPFVAEELGKDELLLARTVLKHALQDVDDWSGYDILEQFQPSAVRYQINNLGWALATLQYARMPAFHGYLSEAQRRLIEKYQQRKVWSYWWIENLWGNLELNPDPVRKQNVMLSGFFGLQVAMYQSATGDMRYSAPGSIEFRWSRKRSFSYDLPSICDAMARDIDASDWGMIVCEPNWIYSYCNSTAVNSFIIQDRMGGTDYWDAIKGRFTRTVSEEMHRPDGTAALFKSSRTGYANGGSPLPSVEYRPSIPDLADRGWALTKAGVWTTDENGKIEGTVFKQMPRGLDPGNAGTGKVGMYAGVMDQAREAGDEERFDAAWRELQEVCEVERTADGLTFPGASMMALSHVARGMFNRKGGWLDLIQRGLPEAWACGPVLADVPFDDAMVARAATDGSSLDLVLHPVGDEVETTLTVERLRPDTPYTVRSEPGDATAGTVKADDEGRALLPARLRGRTRIELVPDGSATA